MSLEAARDLSISELLRVLNEKLDLECTRLRDAPFSLVSSTASLELEIKGLEAGAQEILRTIPHWWNLFQPANRLPPEIISHIARCVLDSWSGATDRIISLTHVCRYWRETIISAPNLWTSVSSYPIGLMAMILERTKAVPLQLSLPQPQGPRLRDLLVPYIQNTETLWCYELVAIEDFTQTLPNFPMSMPNLRSLTLEHMIDQPTWDPSADPFELFPNTMTFLSLCDVPLYPSFLRLGTLTKLVLRYYEVCPPLDAFLDLLGGNCSLEHVDLTIDFEEFPTPISQHRDVIMNRLRYLSITCWNVMIARTMVSSIPLQKGVQLEIALIDQDTELGLNDILSGISATHLSNLSSPTVMEYRCSPRMIGLNGPNGSFLYTHDRSSVGSFQGTSFIEFPVLPLTNIQEICLLHSESPTVFRPPSFPALETFAIGLGANLSHLFSALFSNPSALPSLKALEFRECILTEEFMEELTQFASARKNTTSAWLHRTMIAHQDGKFPNADSIRRLGEHVPVVDVLTLGWVWIYEGI